jgi:hypothetical protein
MDRLVFLATAHGLTFDHAALPNTNAELSR